MPTDLLPPPQFENVALGEPLGPVIKIVRDEEFGPSFKAFREFQVFTQAADDYHVFRTDASGVRKVCAFEFNLVNIGDQDCVLANRFANPEKYDSSLAVKRLKGLWGVTLTDVATDALVHEVVGTCQMQWDAVRADAGIRPKFGGYASGITAGCGAKSVNYFGNLIDVTGWEGRMFWADFQLFPTGEFAVQDRVRVKIKMEGNSVFRCEASEKWPGAYK